MKKKYYLIYFSFLIIFFGCKKDEITLTGTGDYSSQAIQLEPFEKIQISLPATVLLKKGNEYSANITSKQNILSNIRISVDKNGLLEIFYKNNHVITDNNTIELTLPTLKEINITTSCNVTMVDSFPNILELAIKHTGKGKIVLKGSGYYIMASLSGTGIIDASNYSTTVADAYLSGKGFVYLNTMNIENSKNTGTGEIINTRDE